MGQFADNSGAPARSEKSVIHGFSLIAQGPLESSAPYPLSCFIFWVVFVFDLDTKQIGQANFDFIAEALFIFVLALNRRRYVGLGIAVFQRVGGI